MTKTTIEEYKARVAKWVEALPSYEQCQGGLHQKDDGYCCLGVACEVSQVGGYWDFLDEESDGNDLMSWVSSNQQGSEASLMPADMVEYYGLVDNIGSFDWFDLPWNLRWLILQHLTSLDVIGMVEDEQKAHLMDPDWDSGLLCGRPNNLAWMNDRGVSFWLIAEIIKAKPKGLFTWTRD